MGMFERLGEKVERFKQEAVSARDESADYRCRNCGSEIFSEQEQCPECGSSEIERVTEPETTTETADGEDDTEPDETVSAETIDESEDTEDTDPDVLIEEAEHDEDTEA
ncbi:FmdB family zinc ribbon protein [Natronorubrum texcoconense]|uniref:Zinc-ribbon domain-containing protein n=1 Tax=Natronorubrum texcoconense TaxID=1095776 RepID=A0A1G8V2J3_9EURY|nr:zinc ribbon domain-containing protein [Natronorubrum texcoconense]SDJ60084.1 hypothetical protein SAMN04515672_1137 [Natronorubrum texcoconense]